jgi:hypothetical protein
LFLAVPALTGLQLTPLSRILEKLIVAEKFPAFRNMLVFYGEELLALCETPKAGEPPLVCCPRLLVQYIRSYPPYLQAVSSTRNLRTRHVVTRDPLNMKRYSTVQQLIKSGARK